MASVNDPGGAAAHAERTRFAARFECIGGACEDSCCSFNWRVGLDRDDYSRLKAALSGTPVDRERFERGCARTPGARPGDRAWATLQRTDAGACVFLAADRRCSVQAAHGAAALPGVCATYPRILTRVGDRLSLTDTLSCPEAARLCLLADDACALEPTDPASLARLLVRRHVPRATRDALVRHFVPVRDAFLGLLAGNAYPVPSRLVFALHLARRLDGVRGTGRTAGAAADIGEVIRDALRPAMLDRLHRECRAVSASGTGPLDLVQEILSATLRQQHDSRLASLVRTVTVPFPGEGGRVAEADDAGGPAVRGPELAAAYGRSRGAWEDAFAGRIARYLANYVANLWLQEPFTASPDLTAHVLGHLARVATVRFLLFMHPALREVGPPRAADPRHGEALDRAVVEVVYLFSRAIEHGPGMGTLLQQIVAEHRVKGRRRALELAAF